MSFGITASSFVTGGGPTGDSPYANAVLADNPLVYLPLNETSGSVATDISGNGRDGTYANVVLEQYSVVSGSLGRSIRTDNTTGSITIAHAAWMDTAELTVLTSCMLPPGGISMVAARYASDPAPNSNSWFIDVGQNGNLFFYYRTSGGSDVGVDSGIAPVPGKRLYVAAYVSASESGIRVYEDGGTLIASNTGAGGVVNTSGANLTLLCSQQPNYGIVGYMDDFALFGTALSTARLDQLAALAFAPHQTWITRTEGTAARNGTYDHTINFTPAAAGSLLVAVVGGPVTHTMVTAGWTKQLGPIDSTELAVFTKTAGAGELSFQLTHNGANYPVEYAVYEFAAGSSYYAGASIQSTGPFPTLSGLPGTRITVLAAQSQPHNNIGSTPNTTLWNYFWRTDVNRNSLYDGVTGGSFLNVGYFAFSDFPDATADVDYPGPQHSNSLHYEQAVLFAIQHP